MPNITFVDSQDQIIGYGTKAESILKGHAQRISRVFLYNSTGQLLIQKRSLHVAIPGRWDSSAAGHVDEGEDYLMAAKRELLEEVGVSCTLITEITKLYTEDVDDDVTRKRFNMLYKATFDGDLRFYDNEVSETMWIDPHKLDNWMARRPQDFTQGLLKCYAHLRSL